MAITGWRPNATARAAEPRSQAGLGLGDAGAGGDGDGVGVGGATIESSWIVNTSVALAGIVGGWPWLP